LPIATRNRLSKENSVISGHAFLFLDNEPVMTSPGLWQFKAIFDTKNNSVPEFNVEGQPLLVPQIQADLSLQILSANRSVSPIKTITFEITYRRELLKPAFKANPELQKVTQNGQWSYSFESYLPSAVGTLTTYLSDETVKLPGTPKLTCKTDKKRVNHQNCRLDWKVPCAMPSGDVVIKVISAAEYQGQNTSMELQKNLSVLENKKCVPPSAKTSTPDTGAGQSANGPSVEATTGAAAPATAGVTPQKKAAKPVPKNTKSSKSADHKTKGAHS
jgi:hypothetical protein